MLFKCNMTTLMRHLYGPRISHISSHWLVEESRNEHCKFPVTHTEMCVCMPEDEHPYAASQLRQAPADKRYSNQLLVALAGTLVSP